MIGFRKNFDYFFTSKSPILVLLPTGEKQRFRLDEEIMSMNPDPDQFNNLTADDLKCTICDITFSTIHEFNCHVEGNDREHIKKCQDFLMQDESEFSVD